MYVYMHICVYLYIYSPLKYLQSLTTLSPSCLLLSPSCLLSLSPHAQGAQMLNSKAAHSAWPLLPFLLSDVICLLFLSFR